jgi:hypothetical protein
MVKSVSIQGNRRRPSHTKKTKNLSGHKSITPASRNTSFIFEQLKIPALIDLQKKEVEKINRIAGMYNMIPNLLWTALFLIPITIFCYRFIAPTSIFIVLGTSILPIFFPNSFFDKIQLSRSAYFYRRIGVRYINSFAQNGSLLNKF